MSTGQQIRVKDSEDSSRRDAKSVTNASHWLKRGRNDVIMSHKIQSDSRRTFRNVCSIYRVLDAYVEIRRGICGHNNLHLSDSLLTLGTLSSRRSAKSTSRCVQCFSCAEHGEKRLRLRTYLEHLVIRPIGSPLRIGDINNALQVLAELHLVPCIDRLCSDEHEIFLCAHFWKSEIPSRRLQCVGTTHVEMLRNSHVATYVS